MSRSALPIRKNKQKTALLGLGGNVGNVRDNFITAIAMLDRREDTKITAVSGLYRTPPWGDEDQDWFLNAAIAVSTRLEPLDLLDAAKQIEHDLKRVKTRRWGPRSLDIDILIYADQNFVHERLELPHPRMTERGFVLVPLKDIAPLHEIKGRTPGKWLENIDSTDIEEIEGAPFFMPR